jgi:hypothetical protein
MDEDDENESSEGIDKENENSEVENESSEAIDKENETLNEKKNNTTQLNTRLEEIKKDKPKTETLVFSSDAPLVVVNVGDDLQREVELFVYFIYVLFI